MSTTVELPNNQTAILKDDTELSNKEVKNLRKSARVAMGIATKMQDSGFQEDDPSTWTALLDMSDEEADTMDLFQRTCVITRLSDWTLDLPLPTTVDEVDDLPRPIYVALTVAAVDINLSDSFDMDGAANPKADTANSNG